MKTYLVSKNGELLILLIVQTNVRNGFWSNVIFEKEVISHSNSVFKIHYGFDEFVFVLKISNYF